MIVEKHIAFSDAMQQVRRLAFKRPGIITKIPTTDAVGIFVKFVKAVQGY